MEWLMVIILEQPTIGLKNYSVGSQSGATNILEVGSNPIFPFREYSSMGFPRIKTINPYSAPMRWGKYVSNKIDCKTCSST